jgi:uncharacterized Tic20 family protein
VSEQLSTAGLPPPGWYTDPDGATRWWDGRAWGATMGYGQVGPPVPNTGLALLAHLGFLVGGFILPLVLYLTTGKRDDYVRHHSAEALNFQLTYLIVSLATTVLLTGGIFALVVSGGSVTGIVVFVVAMLVYGVTVVLDFVWGIIGAIRAHNGEWWRYPVSIRFVQGAAPRDTPPLAV